MAHRWYVLKVKPHAERQVAHLLANRAIELYLPMVPARRRVGTRRIWVDEPYFPGYVFARLDRGSEDLLIGRSTPGVAYILSVGGIPVPVADDVIAAIRARLAQRTGALQPVFQPGQAVRIVGGPLTGFDAIFDAHLKPGERARVLVHFLTRLVCASVAIDDLEPGPRAESGRQDERPAPATPSARAVGTGPRGPGPG